MEENVALDSTKQKKFAKSIKGIKKLLKKKEGKPHVPAVLAPKDSNDNEGKKKKKRPDRGLVYLSHIPHGFYEHQMTQYFKQFGMVTNVRVIRSPRTGRSKGFAFVEFREPAVAEIVAETMNNYLMGKRLIKAVIIPPEKQKRNARRKLWTTTLNPAVEKKIKMKKAFNANKDEEGYLKTARKLLKSHEQKLKKLSDLGINCDFFKPVDIPEALLAREEGQESKPIEKVEGANKKDKKTSESVEQKKKAEPEAKKVKPTEVKSKKELKKAQKNANLKQNEKQKKMKDAGVSLPENFIQLQQESGNESDSSLGFDSDEYEKMLENDSEASGDESEGDGEEEDEEGDESSDEELPQLISIQAKKGKKQVLAPLPLPKNQKQKKPQQDQGVKKPQNQVVKKTPLENKVAKPQQNLVSKKTNPVNQAVKPQQNQGMKKAQPQPQGMKRKNPQNDVSPKKPKFEKKDNKQRKQFKKKNKAN